MSFEKRVPIPAALLAIWPTNKPKGDIPNAPNPIFTVADDVLCLIFVRVMRLNLFSRKAQLFKASYIPVQKKTIGINHK